MEKAPNTEHGAGIKEGRKNTPNTGNKIHRNSDSVLRL